MNIQFWILQTYFHAALIFDGVQSRIELHDNQILESKLTKEHGSSCGEDKYLTRDICLRHNYDVTHSEEALKEIHTNITVKGIREINDKKRFMVVDVKIVFTWHDGGIIRNKSSKSDPQIRPRTEIQLVGRQVGEIWKPEIYIYNLSKFDMLKVSDPISRVSVVRMKNSDIHEDNDTMVKHILEGTASVYCSFEHNDYPMDHQTCQLQISSEICNADFLLHSGEIVFGAEYSSDFDMEIEFYNEHLIRDCKGRVVGVRVKMRRLVLPFFMKYCLPSVSIVIVSGISFIIPLNSLPARVALLVTQFLTLTNIFIHQQVILTIHNQTLYHLDLKRSKINTIIYFHIIFDRMKVHQPNKQPPLESIF